MGNIVALLGSGSGLHFFAGFGALCHSFELRFRSLTESKQESEPPGYYDDREGAISLFTWEHL